MFCHKTLISWHLIILKNTVMGNFSQTKDFFNWCQLARKKELMLKYFFLSFFLLLGFWIFANEIFNISQWKTVVSKLPGEKKKTVCEVIFLTHRLSLSYAGKRNRETKMCFSASTFSIAPRRRPGKAVTSNLILHSSMLFTSLLFIFLFSWQVDKHNCNF